MQALLNTCDKINLPDRYRFQDDENPISRQGEFSYVLCYKYLHTDIPHSSELQAGVVQAIQLIQTWTPMERHYYLLRDVSKQYPRLFVFGTSHYAVGIIGFQPPSCLLVLVHPQVQQILDFCAHHHLVFGPTGNKMTYLPCFVHDKTPLSLPKPELPNLLRQSLLCPLTSNLPKHPVLVPCCGQLFDANALRQHFNARDKSSLFAICPSCHIPAINGTVFTNKPPKCIVDILNLFVE